jgi:hypothetical protein
MVEALIVLKKPIGYDQDATTSGIRQRSRVEVTGPALRVRLQGPRRLTQRMWTGLISKIHAILGTAVKAPARSAPVRRVYLMVASVLFICSIQS